MRLVIGFLSIVMASVSFAGDLKVEGLSDDFNHQISKGEEAIVLQQQNQMDLSLQASDFELTSNRDRRDRRRPRRGRVYCDYYATASAEGFSLYRYRDDQDLGKAIFMKRHQCEAAADLANRVRTGIVCAPYVNNGKAAYSIYMIRSNQDLGNATIGNFDECQRAVRHSTRQAVCSPYIQNGRGYWSPYSPRTGEDIGAKLYGSLNACISRFD